MILGESVDFLGNIAKSMKFEPLAVDPPTSAYPGGTSGAIYYNTTSGVPRIHNGTEWVNIVKINGTAGRTSVTYSGNPMVAVIDIDQTVLNQYLPLSGGNVTGTISATAFVDTNFVGNRALISDTTQSLIESSVTNTELSYLTNVSANIQTQLNQLSQATVSGNGAGTPNRLTKFITSSSMGDSSISDTGSLVTFTTPVSSNNTITAPNFTGLASRATSALQADTLKTSRNFSLSGAVTSNVVSFNGSGNVVLSATLATGINATNIADGSISNTEFQYLNNVSANIQNQLSALSATKANSSVTITAGTMLSGGGDLSTNRTISHQTVGTAGTYSNIVTNSTGHITSARALIASDLPSGIDATKIADGSVTSTEFQYINTLSANVQTQLSNLSATKADKTITITAGTMLSGGGDLSTNRTIEHQTVGTAGTYSNIVTNSTGHITSARALISADIPTIPPSKILEDSNDRFVSDTQINSWTSTSSTVQSNSANWNTAFTSAHNHANKSTLDLINQSVNTSANVLFNTLSATNISATTITVGSIDNTEFSYLNTVSANIQTQLNSKINTTNAIEYLTNSADVSASTYKPAFYNDGGSAINQFLLFRRTTGGANIDYMQFNDTDNSYGFYADTILENPVPNAIICAGDYYDSNFVGGRALISTGKKLDESAITSTELNYLDNVSANIQTQINNVKAVTDNAVVTNPTGLQTIDGAAIAIIRSSTNDAIYLRSDADTTSRFLIQTNGKMYWGDGTSARDTFLYRSGVGELKTDGNFIVGGNISATSITVGNIDNTEFNYLNGTSANIQTQINNLQFGVTGRFSSAINIVYGANSITVNHNLGYLRPSVMLVDELDDQIIIVSPVYITVNQLVLPITSNRAITGARLEVSV